MFLVSCVCVLCPVGLVYCIAAVPIALIPPITAIGAKEFNISVNVTVIATNKTIPIIAKLLFVDSFISCLFIVAVTS